MVMSGVAAAQPAPAESTPAPAPPPADPNGAVEPAVPAPTPAEAAFAEGRALLEAGDYAAACARFEASLKEDPNAPGTLLNLGLCNERLGKTATALGWFRRAQFRAAETGMTDYEDVAKTNTFSLAVRVPTIRIELAHPAPAGSTILLDGVALSELDLAKVEVDPRPHVIELRSERKPPVRVDFTIKDGDNKTIVIPVPAPPVPRTQIVEIDHGRTRRLVAYAVAGGGVLMWGGSLAVSLAAKASHDAAELPSDRQYYKDVARWGGTSLFLAGTAALVGAGYLYVTAPGVERVERTVYRRDAATSRRVPATAARTIVAPVVGRDQLGVAVGGTF